MIHQSVFKNCGSFIVIIVFVYRSHDFCPVLDCIYDLRAFVSCGLHQFWKTWQQITLELNVCWFISCSRDMCSCLYAHFLYALGEKSYSTHQVLSIFLVTTDCLGCVPHHSCTDEHNKWVIVHSFSQLDGVVHVVFVMWALGMGVDF